MGTTGLEVATFNAYQAAVSTNSATLHEKTWELTGLVHIGYFDGGFGLPTFEYFPEPIPSSGNPLGVPSTPELVNSIHHVERLHWKLLTWQIKINPPFGG